MSRVFDELRDLSSDFLGTTCSLNLLPGAPSRVYFGTVKDGISTTIFADPEDF